MAPCVKTIRNASASDNNILTVGEFISEDPRLVSKNFLFSDARYWLYSKRTDSFAKILRSSKRIYKHLENGQIKAIEEEAIRNNADALVLFVNHNQAKNMPEFEHYDIYKRFVTRKGVTGIYRLRQS
jgi:hypothetical protein